MNWEVIVSPTAPRPNQHLGTRFDLQGRFLPEHGNTVVCQVVPGSPTEAALIDLRAALLDLPHTDCFAFTAVESYHMTVFEGVIDTCRTRDRWAADLALELGVDAVTERLVARLSDFVAPPAFAMQVAQITPFGLRVQGASPQDEANARAWRDALSKALGIRTPDHDSYGFHTTVAYVKEPLPSDALPVWRAAMTDLTAAFRSRVPILHLAPPAFCSFADMNAFVPVRMLA